MLDIKFIREHHEAVKKNCETKKDAADIDRILALDTEIRETLFSAEQLKKERNEASKEIGRKKKAGEDATESIATMQDVAARIKEYDATLHNLESTLREELSRVPNMPHTTVPHGASEADNAISEVYGELPSFSFTPKDHLEIGESLRLFDLKRGAKISGSGFPLLTGAGARLNRALLNFFLDEHITAGYEEVQPPYLVTAESAFGTGQLPKSADQMYHVDEDGLYAIPTAEVPVTNIYRDEILAAQDLPKKMCAYTACFRREAGSYGKDTKGFLRLHQFDKVEMVKLATPETSYEELELLRADAERLLKKLGLTYRILTLCDADLSFAAAKCYDLEVWAPGEQQWLEVSSVSNFEDFQARRMNMRYRPAGGKKPTYVHTLNGSGLATARILVALLETYQTAEGAVRIPEVLQPYMGGSTGIRPA
ncbi:serine--tRNA ligase [Chitinivibrio alkaliphilus]|uniref:Serine--tRNA ligase n=1 Tax=Chitinivibrio alkaliphilus ACht1 TaxID=1313304 RepID=U7D998_9BACT|nr:serine--tRNA ligase [Chitinivibrio alkaliphilus]ERP38964.1 seryl-tRNA synthetase [Chitinivibrio alkaliphilus ACht1]